MPLAIVALGASVHLFSAGCGSETESVPTSDGGADGAAGDGGSSGNAGTDPNDNPNTGTARSECKLLGTACAADGECCTNECDATAKVCSQGGRACGEPGAACTTGTQCCTFTCAGGKCSNDQCLADNAACTSDAQCCGAKCTGGTCTPLSTTCKTSGNPCTAGTECCSTYCTGGFCSAAPSFCVQNGDACAADLDCCGGTCTKAAGATLGVCGLVEAPGAGGCTPAGNVCPKPTTGEGDLPKCGGECCSKSCRPYATTGVFICQPPTGCRPTGEICKTDLDCCGADGMPGNVNVSGGQTTQVTCSKAAGAALGRCSKPNACQPAGSICRLEETSCAATDRCCTGTIQQHPLDCQQDLLGIPRCKVVSDYDCAAKGPPPAGTACATSADCCNQPCTPNAAGVLVCSGVACIPAAGSCTTTADCCAGSPCVIEPGSTKGTCGAKYTPPPPPPPPPPVGTAPPPPPPPPPPTGGTTCAQYGQSCTVSGDCCDGVPCTGTPLRCIFPGPN